MNKDFDETQENIFKVYPQRWAVLLCVTFLNISNAAIWISFFPVATMTAEYFETSSSAINWFSLVFMIIPFLCFFITTFISSEKGLKFMVHIGSGFNFTGALIKAFGTSNLIGNKNTQFTITLIGQCVAAVAQTFTIYIPTKVSQVWFPERERGLITTILSCSYSLGVVLTQVITPQIIQTSNGIPAIDYICLGLATAAQGFALIFMTRSRPKSPPSKAAQTQTTSYVTQLKNTFASKEFICLWLLLGVGIGFIAGINTLTQEIICAAGYENELAGLLILCMYGTGYVGAFLVQPLVERYNCHAEVLKVSIGFFCLGYIGISEVSLIPDMAWLLILFYCFYGFFAVSIFPLGLEMCVESTYPVDESITTGLNYLLGQVFALVVIITMPATARESSDYIHNKCNLGVGKVPLDYSISVSIAMTILCLLSLISFLFYKPVFKRRDFERNFIPSDEIEEIR